MAQAPACVCDWCGKECANGVALKQHRRRTCRPDAGQRQVDGFTCDDCGRAFPSKLGLAQHRRRAHLAEYQAAVAAEDVRKRAVFSDLEVLEEELRDPNRTFINQFLAQRFNSDPTVIRNLRRSRRYLALRERILGERRATLAPYYRPSGASSVAACSVPVARSWCGSFPVACFAGCRCCRLACFCWLSAGRLAFCPRCRFAGCTSSIFSALAWAWFSGPLVCFSACFPWGLSVPRPLQLPACARPCRTLHS